MQLLLLRQMGTLHNPEYVDGILPLLYLSYTCCIYHIVSAFREGFCDTVTTSQRLTIAPHLHKTLQARLLPPCRDIYANP